MALLPAAVLPRGSKWRQARSQVLHFASGRGGHSLQVRSRARIRLGAHAHHVVHGRFHQLSMPEREWLRGSLMSWLQTEAIKRPAEPPCTHCAVHQPRHPARTLTHPRAHRQSSRTSLPMSSFCSLRANMSTTGQPFSTICWHFSRSDRSLSSMCFASC